MDGAAGGDPLLLEAAVGPPRRTVGPGGLERRVGPHLREHVVGVERLVGRDEDVPPGLEHTGEQVEVVRADEAALVVLLLRPRVGEEEVDRVERRVGDALLEEDDGVAELDPQVVHARRVGAGEHLGEPRTVHVDGEQVVLGDVGGIRDGRVPVSAADLEHDGGQPAEGDSRVERPARDAPAVGQLGDPFPCLGGVAAAPHEAADAHGGHPLRHVGDLGEVGVHGCGRRIGRGGVGHPGIVGGARWPGPNTHVGRLGGSRTPDRGVRRTKGTRVSMFDNLKKKASDLVDGHGDKVGDGIDKAGDTIDERTGGQHADQVDTGQQKLKDGLDGLDGQDDDIR